MATPEQQAIVALQQELAITKDQVMRVTDAHDTLQRAHEALNQAAQQLFTQKDLQIQESERKLKDLIFRQQFDLLDSKELKPDNFRGRTTDAFKPWQKKMKAFCNSKRTGFRAALEWAD